MGGLRKLYNEEFHKFYSSSNRIRMIMSGRMRWAGHATRMGEECIHSFGKKTWRKETTRKA
jgi:hypothetical protein